MRPFFCQVEAVGTTIWLTEAAPQRGEIWAHIKGANEQAKPNLVRLALDKLGRIPILEARMNPDPHMGGLKNMGGLKSTGAGNMFVVFGEPDIDILSEPEGACASN